MRIILILLIIILTACTQSVPTACQEDAMVCPDGTTLAREGPDCKFPECPENNLIDSQSDVLIRYKMQADVTQARDHCIKSGGTFNECGSACDEGEFCIQVCVPLCTLTKETTVQAEVEVVATTHDIRLKYFRYQPPTLEVQIGDMVRWTNVDGRKHTITSDSGAFDSGTIGNTQSFTHVFDSVGEYSYHSVIDSNMRGQITVK